MTKEEIMERAEKSLKRASSSWSNEICAFKGIGYAILALAKVLDESQKTKPKVHRVAKAKSK